MSAHPKPPGEAIVELLRENTKLLREIDERQEHHGRILKDLERKADKTMASLEEVTQSFETLKADLEAKAAEAKAEFEKLEAEIAEKAPEVDLGPLKEAIDGLDTSVKGAEVPTE